MRKWASVAAAAALPLVISLTPVAAQAKSSSMICYYSNSAQAARAKKLSAGIRSAAAKAAGSISVAVYDRRHGISCYLNSHKHYDSASTVKATILAALLVKRGGPGHLTAKEKAEAKLMITQSNNDAATYLWNRVGHTSMTKFLKKAKMTQTHLNAGGAWGLTQITALDELKLLKIISHTSKVMSTPSRNYELGLMHKVISSQRWGTPAGAPADVTWHVKNGWLPRSTHAWRVHSLGTFKGKKADYVMAILTQDDATMTAGVNSIQRVARVVHQKINSTSLGARARVLEPPSVIEQTPDDQLP